MSERADSVEAIFAAALEKSSPEERYAYLSEACGDDAELRAKVEALLRADSDAGSFLNKPPEGLDATQIVADTSLDFLKPCDKPDRLGMLGPYEIIEVIGRGGMGIVLRAMDVKLNRVVAVKVLAPQLASNAMARQRFLREAQAAAAVSHDHVVTIHAVDETAELPYLVMECIEGQSLQEKIDKTGALPLKEILRIGTQTAAGLAAAHAQGLVHRDVKPSNILLENGVERVKITDFGLARAIDDVSMTQTGQIAGTPQYMSPEQAQGQVVDHRADLFSLGSVLYAMCTGRPAFRADTSMAVMRRVCDDAPRPIGEVNDDVPAWLIEIVDRLLAKNPDERYQSADEVSELLEARLAQLQHPAHAPPAGTPQEPLVVDADPPVHRRPARPRSATHKWLVAGTVLLLLAAVFVPSEWIGVTNVLRTELPPGTLVIEVDDPTITVTISGEGGAISTGGSSVIQLKPGEYKVIASMIDEDGLRTKMEILKITSGKKTFFRAMLEPKAKVEAPKPPDVEIKPPHVDEYYDLDPIRLRYVVDPAEGDLPAESLDELISVIKRRLDPDGTLGIKTTIGDDRTVEVAVPLKHFSFNVTQLPVSPGHLQFLILANKDDHQRLLSLAEKDASGSRIVRDGKNVVGKWVDVNADPCLDDRPTAGKYLVDVRDCITRELPAALQSKRTQQANDVQILVVVDPMPTNNIDQRHLASAESGIAESGRCIDFVMTDSGAKLLTELTSANLPDKVTSRTRRLGIILDNRLIVAPNIMSVISERGQIAGNFFEDETEFLVAVLRGGRLAVKLLPLEDITLVRRLVGHTGVTSQLAFLADFRRFVSVNGSDRTVRLWDCETGVATELIQGEVSSGLSITRDGNRVAVGIPHRIRFYDVEKGEWNGSIPIERQAARLAFSSDGRQLLHTNYKNIVRLWDVETRRELRRFDTASWRMTSYSADGRFVATVDADGKSYVWNAQSGHQVHVLDTQKAPPVRSAFTPDGALLVLLAKTSDSPNFTTEVQVFDTASGKQLWRSVAHRGAARSLAMSSTGDFFVTAGWNDLLLRVWETKTGRELANTQTTKGVGYGLAISPDGRHLVSSGNSLEDAAIHLWRLPESLWTALAKWRQFTFLVSEDGMIRFDGAVKTLDDVKALLQEAAKDNPSDAILVVLRCHSKLPQKQVAEILGACKQAGATNVSLEVSEAREEDKSIKFVRPTVKR